MGLIGVFCCPSCGYRSRPLLLGAGGEPYDLPLGFCGHCRELFPFDPDRTWCDRCGHPVTRTVQDEDGGASCPRCGSTAVLEE